MLYLLYRFPTILSLIKRLSPGIVILEGASWAVYYLFFFYLMKLITRKIKIIYHAHNVEHVLREKKNNAFIAFITKWAEGILMTRVDFATAVSNIDSQIFKRSYGIRPYVLPNGVDTEIFSGIRNDQIHKIKIKYHIQGNLILFMGLTTFKPNREAINFLVCDVFPKVIARFPQAKLAIIGGLISYKMPWLINPGCIPFEEVPIFIKAADICVAPIFSGSGTRLKILEYMAARKPTVATTKGAEGLAVEDGQNIIIADTANKFVEKILYLLNNPGLAKKIAILGEKTVQRSYSWEIILNDFSKKLEEMTSTSS